MIHKPKVHLFNPTCEMEVANGLANYTPPGLLQHFVNDLEMLPHVYASPSDYVLVRQTPPAAFLHRLEQAGFRLPHFVTRGELAKLPPDCTPCPWGWSPSAAWQLAPLGAQWNEQLKPFFSRTFALQLSQDLAKRNLPHTIPPYHLAQYVEHLSHVENLLMEWGKVVIKAPYSSSGRGVQMLHRNHLNINIVNKTRSLIKQQGGVMVEPLLDVLCDLAFEFKLENGQVSFVGYSSFTTTENGQYTSHQIPFSPEALGADVKKMWDVGVLNAALDELLLVLQASELPQHYEGYFGVDALLYRDAVGEVRLQPCLELNLRTNMGIVALHLEQRLAPGSRADFYISTQGAVSVALMDLDLLSSHPLVMEEGKIVSGYLPLTPPSDEAKSMAYIMVKSN